jgi:hypothetical protein
MSPYDAHGTRACSPVRLPHTERTMMRALRMSRLASRLVIAWHAGEVSAEEAMAALLAATAGPGAWVCEGSPSDLLGRPGGPPVPLPWTSGQPPGV